MKKVVAFLFILLSIILGLSVLFVFIPVLFSFEYSDFDSYKLGYISGYIFALFVHVIIMFFIVRKAINLLK